jgi:predicted ferric reductase
MLAATSPVLWYATRATGTVALVLLTASVVLGTLTAVRAGGRPLPRFAVSDLHRRVSLLAVCFVAVHVLTAVLDTYVHIGLVAVVVPFASGYQPLWVGLGTVAFDLLVAVVVSSLLRYRISAGSWRAVHWLAFACWPVAVAHAVGTGTDLAFGWMQVLVALCIVAVLGVLSLRVLRHPHRGGHRTAVPTSYGRAGAGGSAGDDRRPVSRSGVRGR